MFFFIFIPTMFLSGAYSSNAADIVGGLGILSEHIMMATFAAAIGLVIAGPYVLPVLQSFGARRIYIMGFTIMLALNIVCGYTESVIVLSVCSFAMGVVRVFVMLNTIFSLIKHFAGIDPMSMLSPSGDVSPEEKKKEESRSCNVAECNILYFPDHWSGGFISHIKDCIRIPLAIRPLVCGNICFGCNLVGYADDGALAYP